MKLKKAVELLQGSTFYMKETFWSKLAGTVVTEYILGVVDAETLLNDINIDLDEITDEDELHDKVKNGLYSIMKNGSNGVKRI